MRGNAGIGKCTIWGCVLCGSASQGKCTLFIVKFVIIHYGHVFLFFNQFMEELMLLVIRNVGYKDVIS